MKTPAKGAKLLAADEFGTQRNLNLENGMNDGGDGAEGHGANGLNGTQ